MTSEELLDLFRSEMDDQEETYLWADTEVYGYIDDAQNMFCRLTDGIADATSSDVVDIDVPIATDWVDLNPAILKIRGATRTSDGRPLEVVNYEDMDARGLRFDGRTGPIEFLIVGEEEDKARVYPIASVADAIKLLTFRRPLITIDSDMPLEIGSQHHRHLLLWVKHLAYLKQDAETFNRSKSNEFEARFQSYCDQVKEEQRKKRHKVRVVAYGGL